MDCSRVIHIYSLFQCCAAFLYIKRGVGTALRFIRHACLHQVKQDNSRKRIQKQLTNKILHVAYSATSVLMKHELLFFVK